MNLVLAVATAYFVGAIPTSFLAAKHGAGIDLRKHGSKNLGTTNLYRVLGWKYAIPVGIFDVVKGFLPVLLLAPRVGPADWIPIAIGISAVLGHVYPVYLRFSGGKGVATAAGVVSAIAPAASAISVGVWALVLWATGYMSLASMVGAVVFPISVATLVPQNRALLVTGSSLAAFIVFTHRANIRRLFSGTESRFRRSEREA